MRKQVLWLIAFLLLGVLSAFVWTMKWIAREPMTCIQWRFLADSGRVYDGELWTTRISDSNGRPWESQVMSRTGLVEVRKPVDNSLPWYKKPFQEFRLAQRIPYKKGLVHGTVVHVAEDGNTESIQQYREGVEHGIYSFFRTDGGFSHLASYRSGILDGPRISCWTNGLIAGTDIYARGEKNGLSRDWWPTGQLKEEGVFTSFKPTGKHTFWLHRSGAKSHEILYSGYGVAMRTTVWAADGRCIGEGVYTNGHEWKGYFPVPTKGGTLLGHLDEGGRMTYERAWLESTVED